MAQPRHLERSDHHRPGAGHPDRHSSTDQQGIQSLAMAHPGSMPARGGHSRGGMARLRSDAGRAGHFARAALRTGSPADMGGAALRTGRHQPLRAGHHDAGDLGNDAGPRSVPDANPLGKRTGAAAVHPDGGRSADAACSRHRGRKAVEARIERQRGAHEPGGGERAIGAVGMGRGERPDLDTGPGTVRLRPAHTHRSFHPGRARPPRRSRRARGRDPARAGDRRIL